MPVQGFLDQMHVFGQGRPVYGANNIISAEKSVTLACPMHVLACMASEKEQRMFQGIKLKHCRVTVSGPKAVIPCESPVHVENGRLKMLQHRHGQVHGQKAIQQCG